MIWLYLDLIYRNNGNKKNDIVISNFNLEDPMNLKKNIIEGILNTENFDNSGDFLRQTEIKNVLNNKSQYKKDNYLTNMNENLHFSDGN